MQNIIALGKIASLFNEYHGTVINAKSMLFICPILSCLTKAKKRKTLLSMFAMIYGMNVEGV